MGCPESLFRWVVGGFKHWSCSTLLWMMMSIHDFFPPNPLHTTFLFRTHLYQGLSLSESKVPLAIVALSKFDPSLFSLSKVPLFNFSPSNLPVMFVLSFMYVLFSFVWQHLYFCPSSSYPVVFLSQLQEGSTCGVISSFNVLVGCPYIYVISMCLTFNVRLSFDCWLVSMEVYGGFWKWGHPRII